MPLAAAALLVLAGLAGCRGARAGYGVLLWAPSAAEEQASGAGVAALGTNGTVVPLAKESRIQAVYWVRVRGRRTPIEVPTWRIRAFATRQEAERYAASYAPLARLYAYAARRGLPVRERPSQDARIVYRLDTNQVVKVTGRSERPSTAGAYRNYWYRVLTDDGYEGYCFGQYLGLYQTTGDPYQEARLAQARDDAANRILSETWRPEYFREMIASGKIDLRRFREDVGLFPDPEARRIRIRKAEGAEREFAYSTIRKVGASSYVLEDSGVRLELLPDGRLVATYPLPTRLASEVYVAIDEDVGELVRRERERRQSLYSGFAGTSVRSSAYGSLAFGPDMSFAWKGYERLVPAVIPAGAGESGVVDFAYRLDPAAATRFDGVITLRFSGLPAEREVNFFYKREGAALRLVYVARPSGSDLELGESAASSWVLYFD